MMNTNLVGIFWDIENCSIPRNKLASGIIAHIRNAFVLNRMNNREYEFLIACDVTRINSYTRDDINKAGGVTLAHVNGDRKNAADEKLKESMKRFVDTHRLTGNNLILVLISGDIDFVNDLRGYQTRLGCTIILIHSYNCSQQFKMGWNEVWTFHDICAAVAVPKNTFSNEIQLGKLSVNDYQHPRSNEGYEAAANNLSKGSHDGYRNCERERPRGSSNTRELKGQYSFQNQSYSREPYRQNDTNPENLYSQLPQKNSQRGHAGHNRGRGSAVRPGGQSLLGFIPNLLDFDHSKTDPNKIRSEQPQTNIYRGHRGRNRGRGSAVKLGGQRSGSVPNLPNCPAGKIYSDQTTSDIPTEKQEFILMVSGLPGKMDFRILKHELQEQATKVHGRVKYVKNGQAFLTFNNIENVQHAIQLFHGMEICGKLLNVKLAQQIPFDDGKGRSDRNTGSDEYKNRGRPSTQQQIQSVLVAELIIKLISSLQ